VKWSSSEAAVPWNNASHSGKNRGQQGKLSQFNRDSRQESRIKAPKHGNLAGLFQSPTRFPRTRRARMGADSSSACSSTSSASDSTGTSVADSAGREVVILIEDKVDWRSPKLPKSCINSSRSDQKVREDSVLFQILSFSVLHRPDFRCSLIVYRCSFRKRVSKPAEKQTMSCNYQKQKPKQSPLPSLAQTDRSGWKSEDPTQRTTSSKNKYFKNELRTVQLSN
jgi:hypothetical protein